MQATRSLAGLALTALALPAAAQSAQAASADPYLTWSDAATSNVVHFTEPRPDGGFLGVGVADTDADGGARVTSLVDGQAAEQAGLQVGDVVLAIDGTPVASVDQLIETVSSHAAGDQVILTLARGDRKIETVVTLGSRPASFGTPDAPEDPDAAVDEERRRMVEEERRRQRDEMRAQRERQEVEQERHRELQEALRQIQEERAERTRAFQDEMRALDERQADLLRAFGGDELAPERYFLGGRNVLRGVEVAPLDGGRYAVRMPGVDVGTNGGDATPRFRTLPPIRVAPGQPAETVPEIPSGTPVTPSGAPALPRGAAELDELRQELEMLRVQLAELRQLLSEGRER